MGVDEGQYFITTGSFKKCRQNLTVIFKILLHIAILFRIFIGKYMSTALKQGERLREDENYGAKI
ncbi:MAG TPA: hypothetical protein VFO76_11200 [Candidatus Kapabacteria bacterium]|nr:hypothetical protein [Candidatus Kapabacteria bacterium]